MGLDLWRINIQHPRTQTATSWIALPNWSMRSISSPSAPKRMAWMRRSTRAWASWRSISISVGTCYASGVRAATPGKIPTKPTCGTLPRSSTTSNESPPERSVSRRACLLRSRPSRLAQRRYPPERRRRERIRPQALRLAVLCAGGGRDADHGSLWRPQHAFARLGDQLIHDRLQVAGALGGR